MFWELEFDLVSKPVEVVLIAYGWRFGVIFEGETEGGTGVVITAPLLMTDGLEIVGALRSMRL